VKEQIESDAAKKAEIQNECVLLIEGFDRVLKNRSYNPGFWNLKYVLRNIIAFSNDVRTNSDEEKLEPWDKWEDLKLSREYRRLEKSEECAQTADYYFHLQLQHKRMLELKTCRYE
jgi:hypothetical protein